MEQLEIRLKTCRVWRCQVEAVRQELTCISKFESLAVSRIIFIGYMLAIVFCLGCDQTPTEPSTLHDHFSWRYDTISYPKTYQTLITSVVNSRFGLFCVGYCSDYRGVVWECVSNKWQPYDIRLKAKLEYYPSPSRIIEDQNGGFWIIGEYRRPDGVELLLHYGNGKWKHYNLKLMSGFVQGYAYNEKSILLITEDGILWQFSDDKIKAINIDDAVINGKFKSVRCKSVIGVHLNDFYVLVETISMTGEKQYGVIRIESESGCVLSTSFSEKGGELLQFNGKDIKSYYLTSDGIYVILSCNLDIAKKHAINFSRIACIGEDDEIFVMADGGMLYTYASGAIWEQRVDYVGTDMKLVSMHFKNNKLLIVGWIHGAESKTIILTGIRD